MAADFYKHLFLVGFLSVFLITVNSDGQTLTLTDYSSTLNEISFSISTENSTFINVTVTDAYTFSEKYSLFDDGNTTEYFRKVANLTSGSLFTLKVENSNNETLVQNISTVPDSVRNLKATDISFTSAHITWDKYVPPQNKTTPTYKLLYGTDPKLKGVEPNKTLEKNNYRILSNLKPATKYTFNISVFLYERSGQNKSIEFSTLPVLPPNVTVVAVNTSALSVTWKISQPDSIYPEFVNIILEKKIWKCRYSEEFCLIEISGRPGKRHTLQIFSSTQNIYESKKVNVSHHTKPLPPNCYAESTSKSLTLHCSPSQSDFDFYLIHFHRNENSKRIPRNGDKNVSTTFENLQSKTGYKVILGSLSGTERSENSNRMFFTNPSLDQTTIIPKGNKVFVSSKQYFNNCSMCLYYNSISTCKSISGNEVTFDPVKAGIIYLLNVSCNGKWSQPRKVIVAPLPPTDIEVSATTHSIYIKWKFDYNNSEVQNWFISVNGYAFNVLSNKKEHIIRNLTSGTDYTISIWSYAVGKDSSNVTKSIKTYPECMAILQKLFFTTRSITVGVSETKNSFDRYEFELRNQTTITQKINVSKENKTVKFSDLVAGIQYDISVRTIRGNLQSEPCESTITARTNPECIAILQLVTFTTSSIIVNVSKTQNFFDRYEFVLRDQNGHTRNKSVSKKEDIVDFSPLEAGIQYNISVRTISGNLQSKPCESTITARTKPNPPTVVCQPNEREIRVSLTKGSGYIDGFEVNCTKCENFTTIRLHSNNTSLNISALQPNEMYYIMVKTFAGNLMSEIVTCNSTTNESAPSEVLDLAVKEIAKNTYNLTWKEPDVTNGIIRFYLVEGVGKQEGKDETDVVYYNCSDKFQEVTTKPGYVYNITVKAFTVKEGPGQSIIFTSKTYAPGFNSNLPHDMKQPNKSQSGQRSFVVTFPTNPFTDENGLILTYTVIVATSNETGGNRRSVLPNWYQFNKNPSINAYQPISNCTNLYKMNNGCDKKMRVAGRTKRSTEIQSVKFEIGVDDCSKENTSYCNGYLEAGKKYYVKVRAYTQDAFQDTPFSEAIWTESEDVGFPSYALALAVICPLVAILFAGLVFYCVRKRKLPKTSKVEKDTGNFNMARCKPTNHPVNLINFKAHVAHMSSDSDFRFAEEYEDLKDVGKNQELVTAQLMCNRNKNRFANILPYDHSRVKLSSVDDEEGSDYVNANYLPGFNSRREYIVTQGPLCSTRDDFWRMISEQNVHSIVMLTRCFEKSREKCDHYWPESGDPIFYGDVQVEKLHETITPDWTITEFKITVGTKSWNLRHYHFTSWPDFGVPNSPQVLVNFVQTVRRNFVNDGPIVVHCSAGVGRSGTFIAVDHCMQHIQTHNSVDVLGVVHEMRLHRVLMVQTEQQYIYIHHCLLNALEASENEDVYQNVIVKKNGGHDNQAFLEDEGIHVA